MNTPPIIEVVSATHNSVLIGVAQAEDAPVRIYYSLDTYGVPTANWTESILCPLPGVYTIPGLASAVWYSIIAVVEHLGEPQSLASCLAKVHTDPAPFTSSYTLYRYPVERVLVDGATCFRMKIELQSPVGFPAKPFMHKAVKMDPYTAEIAYEFVSVASPSDIEEFPADEPIPGWEPPFFRLAIVDIIEDELSKIDYDWNSIKSDVENLRKALMEEIDMQRRTAIVYMAGNENDDALSSRSSSSITAGSLPWGSSL